MAKKKRRAPERDDQAFRRQSLARKLLELIGLYNQVLAEDLVQNEQVLDPDRRRENVDAVYDGDKVVSFRERGSGIDYKVVDSFSQTSLKKGGGREDYCIIQQSHGDRLYGLLKYNPIDDRREPAPIRFDKARNDRTGRLNMFFIKDYTIISGGIKFQFTIASRPIIEDTIWRK